MDVGLTNMKTLLKHNVHNRDKRLRAHSRSRSRKMQFRSNVRLLFASFALAYRKGTLNRLTMVRYVLLLSNENEIIRQLSKTNHFNRE